MDALHIVYRHMEASPALEARIRAHVERLEQMHGRLVSGQVLVEAPHRHNRQGKLFGVKLQLALPRRRIVVSHEGRRNHAHEDVYVALRDAFAAAERQLATHEEKLRGDVKAHAPPQREGLVARLFPDHGFIATDGGEEIYFHANSVIGRGFATLAPGDRVRLVVAEGESLQGPQASTVVPRPRRRRSPAPSDGGDA